MKGHDEIWTYKRRPIADAAAFSEWVAPSRRRRMRGRIGVDRGIGSLAVTALWMLLFPDQRHIDLYQPPEEENP